MLEIFWVCSVEQTNDEESGKGLEGGMVDDKATKLVHYIIATPHMHTTPLDR